MKLTENEEKLRAIFRLTEKEYIEHKHDNMLQVIIERALHERPTIQEFIKILQEEYPADYIVGNVGYLERTEDDKKVIYFLDGHWNHDKRKKELKDFLSTLPKDSDGKIIFDEKKLDICLQ